MIEEISWGVHDVLQWKVIDCILPLEKRNIFQNFWESIRFCKCEENWKNKWVSFDCFMKNLHFHICLHSIYDMLSRQMEGYKVGFILGLNSFSVCKE